jgi:phenylpyruvate tautomerase PptA (4-oxalocrotonate tautomerase family)
MPLYTITTQIGILDGTAKTRLAESITAFHSDYAGVPKTWVHIVFQEYPSGDGFSAGRPSATAALTLLIRSGRPTEYKREMLKQLWSLLQRATGAPDDEIVLGIQEVPASQAMEMGKVMPDVPADGGQS